MGLEYKLKRRELSCPPYMVSIEATNICNFRCKFCPQSDPNHHRLRGQGKLSVEGFTEFLDKVRATGTANRNISITLDGEPTLNKALPEFIRVANRKGFYPRFSTNAFALTPDFADSMLEAGQFLASIDFGVDPESFDDMTGREGSFARVRENLLYLITKARENSNVNLEIVDISGFGETGESASLEKMKKIISVDGELPPNVKTWARVFHNFCGHLEAGRKGNYMLCPYPWSQFVVAYNGDAVACCRDTAARTVLGNVFESSVMDIWNGEAYREFRNALIEKRPEDVAACAKCDMPYSGGSKRWRPKYLLESLLRR